ncbi:potassium-transporting ATPase subunit KdpA [Planotetraspora phitsanulokensis]|uniref:Potassium-transporting ATPase potassium-binding subunit n=1 Tax=Planotetraspora phitsanulokensis TaxID=575192 RepID=A0A8J3U0J6_9ACTN|nr:potassium-transporting ATPase subunit KdpA [Planotetraspora phitsanulokensis]GII35687.1 potassium-transporting ATPase potassium-binding subunit [Planotetraspora phitsanulokensis]
MYGWLQALFVLALLVVLHVPVGDYMARTLDGGRHLAVERRLYRICGIDPDREQDWRHYLVALMAFTVLSVVALFALFTFQGSLPWSLGHPGMPWQLALHTAVSFTTNTSWQNYAGEATTGHLAVMAGLGVQGFASAAVGMCVGLALIRGLVRRSGTEIGNFWVDLVRSVFRVLLPLAVLFGIVLICMGVQQNLDGAQVVNTVAGGTQTLIGGPVGSWEPVKLMTGDGGGFFNASSAHPFENPSSLSNSLEILIMLIVPTAFIRTFGRMTGNLRLGWTLLIVVGILFGLLLIAGNAAQAAHTGTVAQAVGAQTEGTETRFGIPASTLFGVSATASADGALNASYDSFSSLGGGVLLAAMMLGEIAPGGTGSGLYGLIMVVLVAVFLGGLMVGRTPEFMGKRIGFSEMRYVVLYSLVSPSLILVFTGLAVGLPAGVSSMGNVGAHGLTEVLYAYTSNVNSNGSAMAGLNGNTMFYNLTMTAAMFIGRYLPMAFVLALAGRLVRRQPQAVTAGTLRTQGVSFVVLATGTALIVALLNFLPALSLGPLADGLLG